MARWEPNARERLAVAAQQLFSERGYQEVTVAQITERAGLTKASFFRHFADKREAVFVGQDVLIALIEQAIRSAPTTAKPIECVRRALSAIGTEFTDERRTHAAARQAVIDSEPELQERLLAKCAAVSDAITNGLLARGDDPTIAQVAGQFGQLAFVHASHQWNNSTSDFATIAAIALSDLLAAAVAL